MKKWTFENLQKEALKYSSRNDFRKNSSGAYSTASKMQILDLICTHIPKHIKSCGENSHAAKWTNLELTEIALKYGTRKEFEKENFKAYSAAKNRKILNIICSHMKLLNRKKYSIQELSDIAIVYNTKSDFFKKSGGAYKAAIKFGILDSICAHMSNTGNVSIEEKELLKIIKETYPTAGPARFKVGLLDRPHIKRFYLDVFVEELNKAIEFDGVYWHSIKSLSRNRNKWPIEDIARYHDIKDEFFASKNIQVLHISDVDWRNDKNKCLERCYEFLAGRKT